MENEKTHRSQYPTWEPTDEFVVSAARQLAAVMPDKSEAGLALSLLRTIRLMVQRNETRIETGGYMIEREMPEEAVGYPGHLTVWMRVCDSHSFDPLGPDA